MVFQKEIILSPYTRGFHLITSKIINHIPKVNGIAHLFIKHTSPSLTVNETADPTVRDDFETHFNHMVSENENYFTYDPCFRVQLISKIALLGDLIGSMLLKLFDRLD